MFTKKFSVGLNLDAPLNELERFYNENKNILETVYFSLPLGKAYYTRRGLIKEYENNEEKLLNVVRILDDCGIKKEVTLNTHLDESQLIKGIDFMEKRKIVPDQIACRNESVNLLKSIYKEAEFISCYNNGTNPISANFDSVVVGQGYLRNIKKRHQLVNKGYNLILLVNNGCSYQCDITKCDSSLCRVYYNNSRAHMSIDEIDRVKQLSVIKGKDAP